MVIQMGNYAIVKGQDVINIVVWDGEAEWEPPTGCTAVPATNDAAIGGTYDGSTFTKPAKQQSPQE